MRARDERARAVAHGDDHLALPAQDDVDIAHRVLRRDGTNRLTAVARRRVGGVNRIAAEREEVEAELPLRVGLRAQARGRKLHGRARDRGRPARAEDRAGERARRRQGDVGRDALPVHIYAPARLPAEARDGRARRHVVLADEDIGDRVAPVGAGGRVEGAAEDATAVQGDRHARDHVARAVADETAHSPLAQIGDVRDGDLPGGRQGYAATAAVARRVAGLDGVAAERNEVELVAAERVGRGG